LSKDYLSNPRIKLNIENLSDLIFGLALSIGAVALIGTGVSHPSNSVVLGEIVEFGLSFFILIGIWASYSRIITVLPIETSWAFNLNLALLFCVSIEPFLFYDLNANTTTFEQLDFASTAFALDLGAMYLLQAGLTSVLLRMESKGALKLHPELVSGFKARLVGQIIGGGLFLISIAVPVSILFLPEINEMKYLRFVFWYGALAALFGSRLVLSHGPRKRKDQKHG
jgi:uncharacterized membrane protein